MLNHIELMGRLVKDPELRKTAGDVSVTTFTIAVERDFSPSDGSAREADFIDIVAWRGAAEFATKYFFKGKQIVVDGRLQAREWTDKDGNKRKTFEVIANNMYFADSKRREDVQNAPESTETGRMVEDARKVLGNVPVEVDEDLPF